MLLTTVIFGLVGLGVSAPTRFPPYLQYLPYHQPYVHVQHQNVVQPGVLQPLQQPLVQHQQHMVQQPAQPVQPAQQPQQGYGQEKYSIIDNEWGKANVKLLYVKKEGSLHSIKELLVRTALTLNTEKDYRLGDNSDVIATDSQKNTVNIFAKKNGVESPESFAIQLAEHFMAKYPKVTRAEIQILEKPWERVKDTQGREHVHAFVLNPSSARYAEVELDRAGQMRVSAGIRDLTVLKTSQSGFEDFVSDEYRSLPDDPDRVVSTVVTADWTYSDVTGVNFDYTWKKIQDIILEEFAGPVDTGVHSASVQYTQHLMQQAILDSFPKVERVTIDMPNRHYFGIDFTKFPIPEVQGEGAGEVLLPVSDPTGYITSTLVRSDSV